MLVPPLFVLAVASVQTAAAPEPPVDRGGDAFEGRVLPDTLAPASTSYVSVGLALQPFTHDLATVDYLYGVSVMFRTGPWGPHVTLLSDPSLDGYEQSRFLAAGGLRGYLSIGDAELSYGVAVHAEARLADHFWLAEATPIELGTVLFAKDSWDLELFVGAQRAFGGGLTNHFLIDPNGFDNEQARDEFEEARFTSPWRGFVRLVFGRRLD